MGAPPQRQTVIGVDDDVELLEGMVTALRELGRLESVTEDEVYDFSIRWGVALAGRPRRLAYYSALGLLDDADTARFGALCNELGKVSGLIDRFKLARPRLSGGLPRRRFRVR